MKKILSELEKYGCDMKGTMNRFLDDFSLFYECLNEMVKDTHYIDFAAALEIKDIQKAFNAMHTIKGAVGNMGITPLYLKSIEILEVLRAEKWDNVEDNYKDMLKINEDIKKIISSCLDA